MSGETAHLGLRFWIISFVLICPKASVQTKPNTLRGTLAFQMKFANGKTRYLRVLLKKDRKDLYENSPEESPIKDLKIEVGKAQQDI